MARPPADRPTDERLSRERQQGRRQVALLVLVVVWLASGIWAVVGSGGLLDVKRLEAERARLEAELDALRAANRAREATILAIETDPLETERLARETLDYQRDDEVVFLLTE